MNKHNNKKVNKIEESRIRYQRFHSYFHHMLCTNNFYLFYSNNPRCKYGYLPTHKLHSVDQVPPPLMIYLDDTWDTKVSHEHLCFPHSGAGSWKKKFHQTLLLSAWNTIKYCSHILGDEEEYFRF